MIGQADGPGGAAAGSEGAVVGRPEGALSGLPVPELLDRIASVEPTPGGGSVAALAGALGAVLGAMVWTLTRSREAEDQHERKLDEAAAELQRLRGLLAANVDADSAAYDGVVAAMRLPKATDEDKMVRRHAIQDATRVATAVPLETARLCAAVMRSCRDAARWGFAGAVTDAGVGLLLADAGLHGALYNVEINLSGLTDTDLAAAVATEVAALRGVAEESRRLGDQEVRRRIAS